MNRDLLSASAKDFRAQVWPLFSARLGGGELVPVETVAAEGFARTLDMLGMTDAWQVIAGQGMRALATRVQWGPTCWNSWTIRRELPSGNPTEWHKITMEGDWHRPSYVIQAYLRRRGGPVLGAACIPLAELRAMLLAGQHDKPRPNPVDGVQFVPVWWAEAERQGCQVWRADSSEVAA